MSYRENCLFSVLDNFGQFWSVFRPVFGTYIEKDVLLACSIKSKLSKLDQSSSVQHNHARTLTNYLSQPVQWGGMCFLNQSVLKKPWIYQVYSLLDCNDVEFPVVLK